MRVFIAIELPETTRARWATFAQILRTKIPDSSHTLRWVPTEQFHVTLRFIGNCSEPQLVRLTPALRETLRASEGFGLGFDRLGTFKQGTALQVLWLGVSEGKEKTHDLASITNHTCLSIGFPLEKKPFHPHMTLARSNDSLRAKVIEDVMREISFPLFEPIWIDRVAIMQSELSPLGARYTTLERIPLGTRSGERVLGG